MKIGLGTVQFGCDYGISNQNGQVCFSEVEKILNYAKTQNITTIDTAQGYGNSEEVLGHFDLSRFNVITKVMNNAKLENSLNKLKLNSIYALMFHRANEINDKTWKVFESYKSQKMVKKLGVSVYMPSEILNLINKYPIDIIQCPLNLLDQRFVQILPELKQRNIEIHTRSTFLQGLLLMNISEINSFFNPIKPVLKTLPKNKLQAALGFVNSIQDVDKIIVGVTKQNELKQIINAINANFVPENAKSFIIDDEKFILPQNWKLGEN